MKNKTEFMTEIFIDGEEDASVVTFANREIDAVDEAMNGHASSIGLTLHADGASITVVDDGRGVPVDRHAKTKKSAMEVIFTTLHAGGKFEQETYKTAGGLHGVGASVVNALSKNLVATSKRDGQQWQQKFRCEGL